MIYFPFEVFFFLVGWGGGNLLIFSWGVKLKAPLELTKGWEECAIFMNILPRSKGHYSPKAMRFWGRYCGDLYGQYHVIVGLGIYGDVRHLSLWVLFFSVRHGKELFSLPVDGLVVPGAWQPSTCSRWWKVSAGCTFSRHICGPVAWYTRSWWMIWVICKGGWQFSSATLKERTSSKNHVCSLHLLDTHFVTCCDHLVPLPLWEKLNAVLCKGRQCHAIKDRKKVHVKRISTHICVDVVDVDMWPHEPKNDPLQ